jgi:hypothetical protein
MAQRLLACALGIVCVLSILFLVALRSNGADFDGDWLLEDLTCEELLSAYQFEVEMLFQIVDSHKGCLSYYEGSDDVHGGLHCALIKKDGEFVQGMANDIADVFNAKPECTTVGGTPG